MVAEALLASWRDTPARRAIVDFVARVTDAGGPDAVDQADRVAVFDNDGTLWSEKPIPIQLDFTLFRLAELANADPSLRARQPYKAAIERDYRWLGEAMVKHYRGDDADLGVLMAAVESAFEGMSVESFGAEVMTWLGTASHPVLHRPYMSCVYVPMVELLRYLEANGFTAYIASGGDRDFMRPFAEQLYGIPPERVIGSALGLDFRSGEDDTELMYKSKIEFLDDGPEKPVRIWSRIGRRPLVAGGNSNGDIPMLRFARSDVREGLRLLVLHDDAEREFDYRAGAEDALRRAADRSWTVISIATDWATVFPQFPPVPRTRSSADQGAASRAGGLRYFRAHRRSPRPWPPPARLPGARAARARTPGAVCDRVRGWSGRRDAMAERAAHRGR